MAHLRNMNLDDDSFLLSNNFNAAEYVNEFLSTVKSGDEVTKLQKLRRSLTAKDATSSEAIKDIVFERYRQFIDTSKEVSQLEREIYQLSTLLTDQKNLIESLMDKVEHGKRTTTTATNNSSTNSSQNILQSLMQKMDGIASVLNNLKDHDKILLQSEMILLDLNTMEPLHPIMLVLLSDSLIIGFPADNSKYRFQLHSVHTLDSLAVVNVKRTPGSQITGEQILQLLIFPDQIYIKAESARAKREWFEGIEQAKRRQQQENSLVRQATIRAKRRSIAGQGTLTSKNRNIDAAIVEEESFVEPDVDQKATQEDVQYCIELYNEIQEFISKRDLEGAVEMINDFKGVNCKDQVVNSKWAAIERTVVKMLSDEIKSPGALHGGSQVIHRNMDLLCSLNRATYAMDLFLKRRSKALRQAASELAVSEEPLSYVKQVSALFVNGILDVANGAKSQPKNLCLMLQFASSEMKLLLNLIRRNVIEVAPTIAVLSHTWRILDQQCRKLSDAGLDLNFEVHRLLAPSLQTALETNFSNIFESVRLRISEEKWRPYNLESELALNRYLEEMSDLGFSIDWAVSVSPRYSINLASSACHFSRVAYALSRDLGILHLSHLDTLCDSFILKLWNEFLTFLSVSGEKLREAAAASGSPSSALNVHSLTSQFIVSQVLPLCEETYDEGCGILSDILSSKFSALKIFQTKDEEEEDDEEVANV
uniref:Exocyst component Exo84 C-terminal domain-containing protein n=1 Tax=Panagrolaimus sp. PS1159 TaxID=55785 RepID=A0AC35FNL0_9BILA